MRRKGSGGKSTISHTDHSRISTLTVTSPAPRVRRRVDRLAVFDDREPCVLPHT